MISCVLHGVDALPEVSLVLPRVCRGGLDCISTAYSTSIQDEQLRAQGLIGSQKSCTALWS